MAKFILRVPLSISTGVRKFKNLPADTVNLVFVNLLLFIGSNIRFPIHFSKKEIGLILIFDTSKNIEPTAIIIATYPAVCPMLSPSSRFPYYKKKEDALHPP